MTSPPPSPDAPTDANASPAGCDSPTSDPTAGFRTLAKTLRSRTTDLLAIAVVLMGGLALGGQFSQWWSTDPEELLPPVNPAPHELAWGAGGTPVALEFGDLPGALERRDFHGDRQQAVQQLISQCTAIVRQAETIPAFTFDAPHQQRAEARLLKRVSRLQPVAEESQVWQIYEVSQPFALVIGVRVVPQGKMADGGNRRVVCWGLAMPGGERLWTLYLFRHTSANTSQSTAARDIDLPANASRLLSLTGTDGRRMIGLEGPGPASDWRRHFDRWAERHEWRTHRPWRRTDSGWHGGYATQNGADAAESTFEIQINESADGMVRGLIHLSAAPSENEPVAAPVQRP